MPATYYTFAAAPVQFFILDTNEIPAAQLQWLDKELGTSQARWKLVYGHHPIYSAGAHEDNPQLVKQLLPVLKNRADVYLAGHDHDLQDLRPERVHFFVSSREASIRLPKPGARSIFASAAHGFSVVEADSQQLRIMFIDRKLDGVQACSEKTYSTDRPRPDE